eukprot:TRINITY_DN74798_c0_g1_i1.p1 TRINITY_DN74798_c0_g1~~TRINITY_DN74798_c0_g1_i1.p1  ORF type:complete len:367 (-),score=65.19 TRINITY_DN74798_c0_g1_i1:123-1223(-)
MSLSSSHALAFAAGTGIASLGWYLASRRKGQRAPQRRRNFVGIDLGGTTVSLALLNDDGCILASRSSDLPADRSFTSVTKRIISELRQLLDSSGFRDTDVTAVGIGAPGSMDCDRGVLINAANFDWKDVPLTATIESATGLPTYLENDANAAMLAEWWVGAGAGPEIDHMVMLTLGTGIGGGVLVADRLLRGSTGMAGELGHAIIEPSIGTPDGGRLCPGTGVRGILEQYASARAVAVRAKEALEPEKGWERRSSLAKVPSPTCKDVFEHAADGDELAQRLVDETADYLAVACVNACRAYDPQLVVLSGGMAQAGDVLLNPLKKHFQRRWWSIQPASTCRIALASMGNNSGVVGAAAAARQKHMQS